MALGEAEYAAGRAWGELTDLFAALQERGDVRLFLSDLALWKERAAEALAPFIPEEDLFRFREIETKPRWNRPGDGDAVAAVFEAHRAYLEALRDEIEEHPERFRPPGSPARHSANTLLLKSQGKDLAALVAQAQFDQDDFVVTSRQWTYHTTAAGIPSMAQAAPVLEHRATGFYFLFLELPPDDRGEINKGRPFRAEWSPGDDTRVSQASALVWEQVLAHMAGWLAALRNELFGQDVWSKVVEMQVAPVERGTEALSGSEQQAIAAQLDELLEYARSTFRLDAGSSARLQSDFDYLKAASTRLPRLDWRNALLGTAMGWLLAGLVPPESVMPLLQKVVHIIELLAATYRLLGPG